MDPKSTFIRSFKKLYFYRLFRAFYRLSRAFWHQRRSNFVGAVITAATVFTLLGGELYHDLRWLSAPRQLLGATSGAPLSLAKDLCSNVPPQTLALLEEIGFDSQGNLNETALLAVSQEPPPDSAGAGFRPRQSGPAIRWPEWAQPEAESLALTEAPAATLRPVKAKAPAQPAEETQTATNAPAPPAGDSRFFWMTTPKVTPRANPQYGPAPQPASSARTPAPVVEAGEAVSSGALRERRAGNGTALAANIEP